VKLKRELRARIAGLTWLLVEVVPNLPLTVVQDINAKGIDRWLAETQRGQRI
jgi:hypothetical protein